MGDQLLLCIAGTLPTESQWYSETSCGVWGLKKTTTPQETTRLLTTECDCVYNFLNRWSDVVFDSIVLVCAGGEISTPRGRTRRCSWQCFLPWSKVWGGALFEIRQRWWALILVCYRMSFFFCFWEIDHNIIYLSLSIEKFSFWLLIATTMEFTWSQQTKINTEDGPSERCWHSFTAVGDSIFLIGGLGPDGPSNDVRNFVLSFWFWFCCCRCFLLPF